MEKTTKKIKELAIKIPLLNKPLQEIAFKRRFNVERRLLKGTHQNNNTHRSIIHFSLNKAATQYVKSILQRASLENGLTPVGLNEFAFDSQLPFLDHLSDSEMQQYKHAFRPKGYLYSVFGGFVKGIENFTDYTVVLTVRDPRDILVSDYFSIAYSHVVPGAKSNKQDSFLIKRQRAREMNIDEFARAEADNLLAAFRRYTALITCAHPRVHVFKYEEMISNFESWLHKLLGGAGLEISDQLRRELRKENLSLLPSKEDKTKHHRKGKSGDYLEKLEKETIDFLNVKFEDFLRQYKYS
jgi:hypothetical protein